MSTVTAHTKDADGFYQLTVTDSNGDKHEFVYSPLEPDATLYEGGPALTESDYIAQQATEACALVDAATAPVPAPENLL